MIRNLIHYKTCDQQLDFYDTLNKDKTCVQTKNMEPKLVPILETCVFDVSNIGASQIQHKT